MARHLLKLFLGTLLLLTSCNKEEFEAPQPTYLQIPQMQLATDYVDEGSAHHKIDAVWLYANNEPVGVFELPATVPAILEDGQNDLLFFPGISANGVASTRVIYDPYTVPTASVDGTKNDGTPDTIAIAPEDILTAYKETAGLRVMEDFDQSGLNFQQFSASDTGFVKTNDSTETFNWPDENNGAAGKIVLDEEHLRSSNRTVLSYELTRPLSNVYVELSYKTEIPFEVGIIAETFSGDLNSSVVRVNEKDTWNKIYVSMIDDVNAFSTADNFKFYIAAQLPSDRSQAKILIDNVKLAWTQ